MSAKARGKAEYGVSLKVFRFSGGIDESIRHRRNDAAQFAALADAEVSPDCQRPRREGRRCMSEWKTADVSGAAAFRPAGE